MKTPLRSFILIVTITFFASNLLFASQTGTNPHPQTVPAPTFGSIANLGGTSTFFYALVNSLSL